MSQPIVFTWRVEPFFGQDALACRSDVAPELYNPVLMGYVRRARIGIGWTWRACHSDARGWTLRQSSARLHVENHEAVWISE